MSFELLNLLEPNDMVVHHHEPEHRVKKYGHYLQGHGPSKGLRNQNMTGSTISSELFLLYLLNDSFASKLFSENRMTVFRVKVKVKVQNFSWCFSG